MEGYVPPHVPPDKNTQHITYASHKQRGPSDLERHNSPDRVVRQLGGAECGCAGHRLRWGSSHGRHRLHFHAPGGPGEDNRPEGRGLTISFNGSVMEEGGEWWGGVVHYTD